MSPLAWDLAHIAAYEDLWLVHRHGGEPLLHPELAAMYDAFETPRDGPRRPAAAQPRRGALTTSPTCASARWRSSSARAPTRDPRDGAPARAAAQRDDAAGDRARPPPHRARARPARRAPTSAGERHRARGDRRSPPGRSSSARPTAASPTTTSARATRSTCPAFRIGRTAITNATFLRFVEGGGYQRREWWSDEGWAWKEEYDITHPQGWAAGPDGWRQWRIDGDAPLHPEEPVVHISWFEADAFARAHGARLPTEAEWEKAATWAQDRDHFRQDPQPRPDRPRPPPGRRRPGRRPARHARRHVGVDGDRVRRLPRLRRPPVPRVLGGVLPQRLLRPARRLVGDPRRASRPRPSATGTSPSGGRSSPA